MVLIYFKPKLVEEENSENNTIGFENFESTETNQYNA